MVNHGLFLFIESQRQVLVQVFLLMDNNEMDNKLSFKIQTLYNLSICVIVCGGHPTKWKVQERLRQIPGGSQFG